MRLVGKTTKETLKKMQQKLGKVVPAAELRIKAELVMEIEELKKKRNAVILGHNYMEPALYHTVPDFVGDSLALARKAAETDKDIIVFCGVKFMGETAKILSPDKTVLVPSPRAGCSLAESITADDVRKLKKQFQGVPVISYVNTYADVKAESDYCCTSGNAAAVVNAVGSDTIIFLPDEYLARNTARETGRTILFPGKNPDDLQEFTDGRSEYLMIGWQGKCEVHEKFTVEDIMNARRQFPGVVVLAHPECSPHVCAASDFSGSTSAMVRYVRETDAQQYLLMTECAMGDNIAAESIRCPHMNEITLEMTRDALANIQYVIEVPEEIRLRAREAVDRMIAIG